MGTDPVFDTIKHLVGYAEQAYKNDNGIDFRFVARDLTGFPLKCRYLQIVTPVWKSIEQGAVSGITSNTHVHLGIRNGDTLVLAFRGTDFPMTLGNVLNPERWKGFWSNVYTDFCYSQTALKWDDEARYPVNIPELQNILVHEGFLLAFNSLLKDDKLLHCIQILLENSMKGELEKIEICGHSLGGALATLSALWCSLRFPLAKVTCVTLGSPRVGNQHFRTMFDVRGINCYRLMNDSDPIPTLPDKYTELLPMRITPSNPLHIKGKRYTHTGEPIWLHVGREIKLGDEMNHDVSYSFGNPPDVQHGEDEMVDPVFDSLQKWGVLSWLWFPYWTGRMLRVFQNLPKHDPTLYVTLVGRILENPTQPRPQKQ